MDSTKDRISESLMGYVKVEREGDLIRSGSRIERVTRSGETVLQSLDTVDTCSWIRKYRGTIRSSPQREKSSDIRTNAKIEGWYRFMPTADTYALGVHALREACQKDKNSPHPQYTLNDGSRIYRPLTFKETIEARVKDYESHKDEERFRLFQHWNDSCTGIAYKAETSKFKIIPECQNLITISKDFNGNFLPITYDSIVGIELQSDCGKYNQSLTKDEVVNHPAWLTAVENDKALLRAYSNIVFAGRKLGRAMGFYVWQKPKQDELRALFVYSLNGNSDASGDGNLSSDGSFLLVAPSGAPQVARF